MKKILACLLALGLSGCGTGAPPTAVEKAAPRVATNPTMSPGMRAIVLDKCIGCHDGRGGHSLPAGIDLSTASSLTTGQLSLVNSGVNSQAAPAGNEILTNAELDTIGHWLIDRGQTVPVTYIPSTWTWYMSTWLSGKANGYPGEAAGGWFPFAIEDWAKPDSFVVKTYTDRDNVTKKGLAFQNFSEVNQDSFASSHNRVHYMVTPIPFGGRFKEGEIRGWVRQDRHMGFFVHGQHMEKGASQYDARDQRHYVRIHFDRDGLHLRGFVEPGLTGELETYPWAGTDPVLTAVSGYTLNDRPAYQAFDDKWYWMRVTCQIVSGDMVYHARVWTESAETNLKWECKGYRADDQNAWGYCGLFNYTANNTNKWDMWADVVFAATTVKGAGQVAGCRDCDADIGKAR